MSPPKINDNKYVKLYSGSLHKIKDLNLHIKMAVSEKIQLRTIDIETFLVKQL